MRQMRQVIPESSRVILFGSQVHGNAHTDSDLDILVLFDKKEISFADFDTYAYPMVDLGKQVGEYFNMKLHKNPNKAMERHTIF